MKTILKISRPRFWLYLAGPFLVAMGYGLSSVYELNLFLLYSLFFFLIPANIYLYGINDLFDRDTDKFNVKKTKKEHQLKNKEINYLIKWLIISFIFLIPLLFFSDLVGKVILIVWFLLSTFYSAIIRFKAIPFLDFMSNMLYIMPGIYGYYIITNNLPNFFLILAFFLWAWAMHLFSAIPDIKSDKKANVITTAVFIGKDLSLLFCFVFWLFFSIVVILNLNYYGLITLIYPLMVIYTYFNIKKIDKIYWAYPYFNGIIGFLGFLHGALIY